MYLNNINSNFNKKKRKRVGRGIGSSLGKTCGKGHKGQRSRSGFSLLRGFEGGQMPLHMRLPKFGFISRKKLFFIDVPLYKLNIFDANTIITLDLLKDKKIINKKVKVVKVYLCGVVNQYLSFSNIIITKGVVNFINNLKK